MRRIWKVVKHGGQVLQRDACISMLGTWLDSIGNGQYTLTLERKKQARSINQNNLMWLWFTAIAEEWSEATGKQFVKEDVHDAYCEHFLRQRTPPSRAFPEGREYAGRTSDLDSSQMAHFLNQVQADAQTEYGITLPNPEDQWFEAWAQQYNNQ